METLKEIIQNSNLIIDELYWKGLDSSEVFSLKNSTGESLASINQHLVHLLKGVQESYSEGVSNDDILDEWDLIFDKTLSLKKKRSFWFSKKN